MRALNCALVLALCLFAAPVMADTVHWPQWRGTDNTGSAPGANPPLEWSEEKNVAWKVDLPGLGHASPVVWGDMVFILSAEEVGPKLDVAPPPPRSGGRPPSTMSADQKQAYKVMAYSTKDGKQLWSHTAIEAVPPEGRHLDASFASASPTTDGDVLVVSFGSVGIFGYDMTGKQLWHVDLGDMQVRNAFGEGASPLLVGDNVVINWDHEGEPDFIVALDKRTGEEVWRTPREGEPTSWTSPILVDFQGKKQIIVSGHLFSRGYDPGTGEELWRASGMTKNVVSTPVYADGVVYVMSGFRGNAVQAIDLAKAMQAEGDVNGTDAIIWSDDRETPYVPSPVLYDDILYFLKRNNGILSALDAQTGSPVYRTRIDLDNIYASPVAADGRIYFVGRDGKTLVVKAGDIYEVIAENQLDDGFDASPAVVGDALYLRGRQHLYKLHDPNPPAAEEASSR
ncbi:MAG: PQQ-binding-like beta-propeller repeat protein [Acidobacteriota bacterium]